MKKAVIFDMDGVLVDSEPLHKEAETYVLAKHGIQYSENIAKQYTAYGTEELFWKDIANHFRIELDIAEAIKQKQKYYFNHFNKIELIQPAIDLLQRLKSHNCRIALASSSSRNVIKKTLSTFSLEKYFEFTISSDDVNYGKPAPDVFILAAQSLKIDPQNCIVIEDSVNGVKAGKAAGMTVVAVPNAFTETFNFSEADYILKSLDEFSSLNLIYMN